MNASVTSNSQLLGQMHPKGFVIMKSAMQLVLVRFPRHVFLSSRFKVVGWNQIGENFATLVPIVETEKTPGSKQ